MVRKVNMKASVQIHVSVQAEKVLPAVIVILLIERVMVYKGERDRALNIGAAVHISTYLYHTHLYCTHIF